MFGSNFLARVDWCQLEPPLHLLLACKGFCHGLWGLWECLCSWIYCRKQTIEMRMWICSCRSVTEHCHSILFREDKNTMSDPQRKPPGCDRVRSTRPPTSRWSVHSYVWWVWWIWTHAVPRQHRLLLVCGSKWTGNPRNSVWAWKHTHVWVELKKKKSF